MKTIVKTTLSLLLVLNSIYAQGFGQNKVQYRDFNWKFIQSPHFDIYFYADGQPLAEFTSEVIEEAYNQVSTYLDWELRKRVSIDVKPTNITTIPRWTK